MRRRLILSSLLAAAVLCAGALAGTVSSAPLMAVYNPSPSMPTGWYVRVPLEPAVGRIVVIDPPLGALYAGWPAGMRLIKPVVAVGGDRVCMTTGVVIINSTTEEPTMVRIDGTVQGGWSGCRLLAADELFLLAPKRPDSVDSRIYGPVSRADVLGVFVPVWTEDFP